MNNDKISVMHVCYLSPNQTGYETRVVEETSTLQKSGFNVIIACFVDKKHFFPKGLYERLKKTTKARVYIIPTAQYFEISIPAGGVKSISWPLIALAKLHKIQIIHGQAIYSTMHALRVKDRIGAKLIYDVHGASPEEEEMSGSSAGRIKTMTAWEEEALRTADFRIFVSRKMKKHFENKYGLPELPHAFLPCCVHSEKFQLTVEMREAKRISLGINDKFVFSYLGTLSVWQWPDAMFSLFAKISKQKDNCFWCLIIPKNDHEKAISYIKKYNIDETKFLLKEVPHEEVGTILGVSDIGLLLRQKNIVNLVSSPTKFGEYLAAGVPVIASDEIGDTSNYIKDKMIGVIIDYKNGIGLEEDEITKIIEYIVHVEENRENIGNRCCEVSNEILSWKNGCLTLIDSYSLLVQ